MMIVLYVDRRKEILEMILENGSVKVSDLVEKYSIGKATIRRDLKYLAENNGVKLTYGGAFADDGTSYHSIKELSIQAKRNESIEEKTEIAKKASQLINDGDTIALNAGTTVEMILDYLDGITKLNVVTLSLNVAVKAATLPFVDLYMPGGKLRSYSGAFYGKEAEDFLRKFSVDKAFFGVNAVSLKDGVTHSVFEEVSTNRILFDISNERYLVADSSKFDKMSLVKMADLDEFDGFVVDNKIDEKYVKYAEINDIDII